MMATVLSSAVAEVGVVLTGGVSILNALVCGVELIWTTRRRLFEAGREASGDFSRDFGAAGAGDEKDVTPPVRLADALVSAMCQPTESPRPLLPGRRTSSSTARIACRQTENARRRNPHAPAWRSVRCSARE